MTGKVPDFIQIRIDERKTNQNVGVRFSLSHDRRHLFELQEYEERVGTTTITLKRVKEKKNVRKRKQ